MDDERDHIKKVQAMFSPEAIDAFVARRPGVLSEHAVELLKEVHLVTVENNPGASQLKAQREMPRGHRDSLDRKRFEDTMTPASRVMRDIYNHFYDVVITDLNMPAADAKMNDMLAGAGGYQVANAARLADVPVIFNSTIGHEDLADNLMFMSPFTTAFGAEPSANHTQFSLNISNARKDNQEELYVALADKLEHLKNPPIHVCAER